MLTDKQCRALLKQAEQGQLKSTHKAGDGQCLYLRAGKYWKMSYRFDGKQKELALGVYPRITLEGARRARDEAQKLVDQGIDPQVARKERKAEIRKEQEEASHSFEIVARERFAKKDASRGGRVGEKMRDFERYVFPYIGPVPVSQLKRTQLIDVLKLLYDRPKTAGKICAYISQVCKYAVAMGYIESDPSACLSNTLPVMPEVKHIPHLEGEREIGLLCIAIDEFTGFPSTRYALKLALLMGDALRSKALRNSRWKYIDLEKGLWTVPKGEMKVKTQAHTVALPRQAVSLLKELQQLYPHSPEDYVFPGTIKGNSLSSSTLNQAIRRMGYTSEELCFHGIRGTFSTWANTQRQQGDQRFDAELIEKCLAHKGGVDVRFSYDHSDPLEARRQILQLWADALDDMARKAVGKSQELQDRGRE